MTTAKKQHRVEGAPYLTYLPYNNIKLKGLKVTFRKVYGARATVPINRAPHFRPHREGISNPIGSPKIDPEAVPCE